MKKRKTSIPKQTYKSSRISKVKGKSVFASEKDFILIFGGGFLVIALGLMIF